MFDSNLTYTFCKENIHRVYKPIEYYIDTIDRIRNRDTNRYFDTGGYHHIGMTLLEKLISDANVYEDLERYKDLSNFDYYSQVLIHKLSHIEHGIDPIQTHVVRKNDYFVKGQNISYKEELILPVRTLTLANKYLFNTSWKFWSRVRSLRLIMSTTNSLTFTINTDRLKYNKDCPDITVFSIDIVLLVLQYRMYLKEFNLNSYTTDIVDYLHKYVIFPCLKTDPLNVWFLNLYNDILVDNVYYEQKLLDTTDVYATQTRIGAGFPNFYIHVQELFNLVKAGSVKPEVAFNTLMTSNKVRYSTYYKHLRNHVQFFKLSQYNHLEFLTYSEWFKLMATLLSISPLTKNRSYKNNLLRELNNLKLRKFWNNGGMSTYVKTYTCDMFNELYDMTTNL